MKYDQPAFLTSFLWSLVKRLCEDWSDRELARAARKVLVSRGCNVPAAWPMIDKPSSKRSWTRANLDDSVH